MSDKKMKLIDRYVKFFAKPKLKDETKLVLARKSKKLRFQLSNPFSNKKRHFKKLYKSFTPKQKNRFSRRVMNDMIQKAQQILEQISNPEIILPENQLNKENKE